MSMFFNLWKTETKLVIAKHDLISDCWHIKNLLMFHIPRTLISFEKCGNVGSTTWAQIMFWYDIPIQLVKFPFERSNSDILKNVGWRALNCESRSEIDVSSIWKCLILCMLRIGHFDIKNAFICLLCLLLE